MITVGDVMNMRAFDSIWLATPCDGAAAREVTGVGTLDHEPFTGGYEVFTQGEFVFTTLVSPACTPIWPKRRCLRSSGAAWRRWP